MEERKRFDELDAFRGIAALAVVLFHLTGYVVKWGHFGDFPFYFTLGERGVQLFFLVSGFVIYFTLEKSRTLTDFAFSRFTRLYPTYWASLAVWALFTIAVMHNKLWITGFAINATMLQTFVGVKDLDRVYWTLAIELVFYVWMAALFALGQLRNVVPFCLGWLGLSFAWGLSNHFTTLPDAIDTYLILKHIPYFAAGIMFRKIQLDGWRMPYIAVLGLAIVDNAVIAGLPEVAASLCFFGVFALAIVGRMKWLSNPVLLWLGAISYPLYVTHRNMGYEILQILHDHGVPSMISVPAMLVAALALASALTYGFERPAMKLLRRWYGSIKSARTARQATACLPDATV
jgi:peptidoglycan/LPS O-acetylase OafA/YrhL